MPTITKACPHCGHRQPCPTHHQTDNQRRHRIATQHGLYTTRWRNLSKQARTMITHCQRCGTTHNLTTHLHPSLQGNHHLATIDDITVLCTSCHGTIDAPRATK